MADNWEMNHDADTPFARLTPGALLDALEAVGLRPDGRLQALNSYENRVWLVGLDDAAGWVVAKFYRDARWSDEQILEEHEFVAEMAAEELPVVAPLLIDGASLQHHDGFRFALYPRQGGRAPELDREEVLRWLGRLLARIHNVGARQPFLARERLDRATLGDSARDWLLSSATIPPQLRAQWGAAAEAALAAVTRRFDAVGPVRNVRLHGDCHWGNVLWTPPDPVKRGGGPHFVDFDDARQGPAVQDLWMLISGNDAEADQRMEVLLDAYSTMREFDRTELGLVEALRTLRLLHHSVWLARRWNDPAFPAAFPWFAAPRYWEERIAELYEQVERMEDSALAGRDDFDWDDEEGGHG